MHLKFSITLQKEMGLFCHPGLQYGRQHEILPAVLYELIMQNEKVSGGSEVGDFGGQIDDLDVSKNNNNKNNNNNCKLPKEAFGGWHKFLWSFTRAML